jgi:hypothetical protein
MEMNRIIAARQPRRDGLFNVVPMLDQQAYEKLDGKEIAAADGAGLT